MSITQMTQAPVAGWTRVDALAVVAIAAPLLAGLLFPAVPQWQSYHDFADQRTVLGLPYALNVLSNLPFLAVGALGWLHLVRSWEEPKVALPYALFFTGALLTAMGSAWYHLEPRDATLVWDRLPMALGFAGLAAATIADRTPVRSTVYTVALVGVGVGSVLNWFWGGNLLPYLVMQASFVATALLVTVLVPSRFTHAAWLYGGAALYGTAIVCEKFDRPIAAMLGGVLSGHTLKHLLAAAALFVIYRMLLQRTRIGAR